TRGVTWKAVFTVACVFIAANALVFFAGRSRIAMAPALGTTGFDSQAPYGYDGPIPPRSIEIDSGGSFNVSFSYDEFLARSVRAGCLPCWDPWSGLGFPHLANGLSGVFYPLNYLNLLVPRAYRDWIHLGHWLLGTAFLMLYLSRLGFTEGAVTIGAVVLIAAGWFQCWLTLREIVGVAVWLVFLLYAIERAIDTPAWKWGHAAIAVGVYGQIAAGHPEAFIPGLGIAGLYAIARTVPGGRSTAMLRHVMPGMVAGVLLAAPAWLNFVDCAQSASTPHPFPVGQVALPGHSLAAYFLPFVFGTLHEQWVADAGWHWSNAPGWLPGSIGFVALCGLGAALRRREPVGIFWGATLLLLGAKMFGAPGSDLAGSLPVLREIIWPRYVAFVPLIAIAVLAGRGVEALRSGGCGRALAVWVVCAFAMGADAAVQIWRAPDLVAREAHLCWTFLALGVAWAVVPPWIIASAWRRHGPDHLATWFALLGSIAIPGIVYGSQGFEPRDIAQLSALALAVFVGLALSLLASGRWAPRPHPWAALIVLLVGASLLLRLALEKNTGLPARYDPLTEPPYIDKLRQLQQGGLYRTYALDAAPAPNLHVAYGLASMSWFVPLAPRRSSEYIATHIDRHIAVPTWYATNFAGAPGGTANALAALAENFDNFSRIAVRYVTAQATDVAAALNGDYAARLQLVYTDTTTGVRIYENPAALPRLSLVSAAGRHEGAPLAFTVGANTIDAVHDCPVPGMLVLTDTMLPGWTALLDGSPAPIELVDGVFRGVRVERAGRHDLRFSYRPPLLTTSIALAVLGLAIVLGGTWSFRRTGRVPASSTLAHGGRDRTA
ncbi:MAG TPA: hypothetical protein VK348_03175, partial [Planctomycetota bacterium]|nr:hypothetical protein [Planctomycetota bacterium]